MLSAEDPKVLVLGWCWDVMSVCRQSGRSECTCCNPAISRRTGRRPGAALHTPGRCGHLQGQGQQGDGTGPSLRWYVLVLPVTRSHLTFKRRGSESLVHWCLNVHQSIVMICCMLLSRCLTEKLCLTLSVMLECQESAVSCQNRGHKLTFRTLRWEFPSSVEQTSVGKPPNKFSFGSCPELLRHPANTGSQMYGSSASLIISK